MEKKDVEKSFKKYADKISADADKRMKRLSAEAEERTQLYYNSLKENFTAKLDEVKEEVHSVKEELNTRIDGVLEVVTEIDRKVDLTFEKVGEIAVDVEEIKGTVKDHEVRLQRLEAR